MRATGTPAAPVELQKKLALPVAGLEYPPVHVAPFFTHVSGTWRSE